MEIKEFYNKYYNNKIETFRKYQKQQLLSEKKIKNHFIFFYSLAILSLILKGLQNLDIISLVNEDIFVLIFMFLLVAPFITIVSSPKDNYITFLNKELLTPFFKNCFDKKINYTFYTETSKEDLKDLAGIISPVSNKKLIFYNCLNFISNNKDVTLADITYKKNKVVYYSSGFFLCRHNVGDISEKALLLKININNNSNSRFFITERQNFKLTLDDFLLDLSDILTQKILDKNRITSTLNENFNYKFDMFNFSDNKLENTEKIISIIMDLYKKYNLCAVKIYKNHLYAIFDSSYIINYDYWKNTNNLLSEFIDLKQEIEKKEHLIKDICELEKWI